MGLEASASNRRGNWAHFASRCVAANESYEMKSPFGLREAIDAGLWQALEITSQYSRIHLIKAEEPLPWHTGLLSNRRPT